MSDAMDVHRLIAEVRKRPTLWDINCAEYKDRTNTPQQWQEIADVLGSDVEHCKRKWKNLRDAYRAEVRRSERRIERLKASGQYNPNMIIHSKWVYFEPMSFVSDTRRAKYSISTRVAAHGSEVSRDDPLYEPDFERYCDIKMEPQHMTTDDDEDDEVDDEDDDTNMLFEEFKSVATPQAARRLSTSISIANAAEDEAVAIAAAVAAANVSAAASEAPETNCKCTKRSDDQVHFLENLEREEQKLMQSTRQDISRASNLGHIGDADYNFLVSFLPQMKKMSELQNLQFRAKMSDLLLNIMTPTVTAQPLPHLPPQLTQPAAVAQLSYNASAYPALAMQGVVSPTQSPGLQSAAQKIQPRSELMDADQGDGVVAVATSSSNWT